MHRRLPSLLISLSTLLVITGSALAQQGPPKNAIYAHDELYTGVNTPGTLPAQGRFGKIYPLGPGLKAVSESAPGDADYRGGRWEVHLIAFLTIAPRQFTNAEDIVAAAAPGEIGIGDVVKRFECPLIPINPRKS